MAAHPLLVVWQTWARIIAESAETSSRALVFSDVICSLKDPLIPGRRMYHLASWKDQFVFERDIHHLMLLLLVRRQGPLHLFK